MLAPADVLKLKCKFVHKMIEYVKKRKYVMNPCIACVYPYYVDSMLADLLFDCITYPSECSLQKKADSYTTPCDPTTVTACGDQIPLALSYTTKSCDYSASVKNSLNGTAYPEVVLTDDSQNITVQIDVVVNNTCNEPVITLEDVGGCDGVDCSQALVVGSYSYRAGMNPNLLGANSIAANNYFVTLRVYKTDSNGDLENTPIDLNIAPSTSDYYGPGVNCPGCSVINAADVAFGSANFDTAFATLMNNISLALIGSTGKHLLTPNVVIGNPAGGNRAYIQCQAKHNPVGEWFGINFNDIYISAFNPDNDTTYTTTSHAERLMGVQRNTVPITVELPCVDLNFDIKATSGTSIYVDHINSNFNYIALSSPYASNTIYGIGTTTASCTIYNLLATYSSSLVDGVAWLNEAEEVISFENTATVTDTGTYTFSINTVNGCEISDDIIIS